jgi:L-asparaginase
VVKTDTDAYDTFRAVNSGPLGDVRGDVVALRRRRIQRPVLRAIPDHAAEPVDLIVATISADDRLMRAAIDSGTRGIVVAATGAGNTDPSLLGAAQVAMTRGIPVVLATRAHTGRAGPQYGFPGGGAGWIASGAIPAGTLTAPKARVVLALGLGAGLDDMGLRQLFADAGG